MPVDHHQRPRHRRAYVINDDRAADLLGHVQPNQQQVARVKVNAASGKCAIERDTWDGDFDQWSTERRSFTSFAIAVRHLVSTGAAD